VTAATLAQPPRQAVILAGGRGTRLRPLTDDRPKPMVEVNGRPFLEYLVELLRDQGIERILLLLGYRADVVQDHFGDGARWNVSIKYAVTPPEDETARRVRLARELLETRFLLLYSDNYWPLNLPALADHFAAIGAPAIVTVYRNRDGWSKGHNMRVEDGLVTAYDRSRRTPGLEGVEIGYAIVERELLDLMTDDTVPIEQALYPKLIEARRLAGNLTDHRYYSIGSHERLPATSEFLARRPTLLLDRDGVLNRRPPRAEYVRTPDEWQWLPGVLETLQRLTAAGYRLIVLSNQAGVARGAMTSQDLAAVEASVRREADAAGARFEAFYYCLHDWDEGCECRKPLPGMFFEAQRDFALDLSRTPYVGDDDRDRQAADSAGAPFLMVDSSHSFADAVDRLLSSPGDSHQLPLLARSHPGGTS
jgi:histidinol-phosphate phosphatase family protein